MNVRIEWLVLVIVLAAPCRAETAYIHDATSLRWPEKLGDMRWIKQAVQPLPQGGVTLSYQQGAPPGEASALIVVARKMASAKDLAKRNAEKMDGSRVANTQGQVSTTQPVAIEKQVFRFTALIQKQRDEKGRALPDTRLTSFFAEVEGFTVHVKVSAAVDEKKFMALSRNFEKDFLAMLNDHKRDRKNARASQSLKDTPQASADPEPAASMPNPPKE